MNRNRRPACATDRTTELQSLRRVLLRVVVELRLACRTAEVVGLPVMIALGSRAPLIDLHAAYWILCHGFFIAPIE